MRYLLPTICVAFALVTGQVRGDDGIAFFEAKIRPVLVEHCYKCHSAAAKRIRGQLRLDVKAGWQLGGNSGKPAILPGMPEKSPLILSVRHHDGVSAMPPGQPKLPKSVLADLTRWVKMGAPDPRDGKVQLPAASSWEDEFRSRLKWWSLQPVKNATPPSVRQAGWPRTDVDRFILARLEAKGLKPAAEANSARLARRLSFALTGLPPSAELLKQFVGDTSPQAYGKLVDALLASPHFGERWARHWMDVVHYADTHGYEWDVPAKNAWRYRDYLIRAFNADVPYQQMVLEQLAGDLLNPRIDPATGLNEALIGPAMLRLGERRHGDNAAAEGVTQEAVANMIDTIGKAFLGTTLACAQCHDHKLDAVEQRDYYALAGILMSTRYSARTLDVGSPNEAVIAELQGIKNKLRAELARVWLASSDGLVNKIRALSVDKNAAKSVPQTLAQIWSRSQAKPLTAAEFAQEHERRVAANKANLKLLADFTRAEGADADSAVRAAGWRWEGLGMKHGLVDDGAIVVADTGDAVLMHLLPAGRFSHAYSQRLAGSLQSPLFEKSVTFSIGTTGGAFAGWSFIIDRALHSERMQFMNWPGVGWRTLTAGNFGTLEGSIDRADRLVYLEFATKALNNYFPPRTGYGGVSEAAAADPRSWFGVTRVYQHAPGKSPVDELARFRPLFHADLALEKDWAKRLTLLVQAAVKRWQDGSCSSEDVTLLNEALALKLLPNQLSASPETARLVASYRACEKKLQPDHTVGSVAEWNEGRNEHIAKRGSYTDPGAEVPRGGLRFLGGVPTRGNVESSGRLELARLIASDKNPLSARVHVNRVWHYLFGAGLVRTPDDFGHLGERPSHPELLDYLAARFMREGWSTKKLIRLLVTSAVWRQDSVPDAKALEIDAENRLWHHMPLRRLEAEAIRDAMLAVSGRLDAQLFGPPIEPYRTAEDHPKRLLKGPLDGLGRRSIYTEMTLMEPPRFLALFNQPIPRQTIGRRDVTNVPDQALALLNDPFVNAMAAHWSKLMQSDGARSSEARVETMLRAAFGRPARPEEVSGLLRLVRRSAELRGAQLQDNSDAELLRFQPAWQDAAHAIFNLKEFIYVP